ncbi:hypothetical protein Salat_1097200 [Sesamum alatum]|uniref:Uncharacterized protein n=1 Tax=Sesamum alatum TaxID=300844 RepID=A0AAE1YMX4_9LAMI|nr:hypothetical protein Salat_1097200 [Sesamum alatum]
MNVSLQCPFSSPGYPPSGNNNSNNPNNNPPSSDQPPPPPVAGASTRNQIWDIVRPRARRRPSGSNTPNIMRSSTTTSTHMATLGDKNPGRMDSLKQKWIPKDSPSTSSHPKSNLPPPTITSNSFDILSTMEVETSVELMEGDEEQQIIAQNVSSLSDT